MYAHGREMQMEMNEWTLELAKYLVESPQVQLVVIGVWLLGFLWVIRKL
jgi:hypothetical protein